MINTSYEMEAPWPQNPGPKAYLPKLPNDPFENIVLKFLKGSECACLSTSCRTLYDRLQYSSAKAKKISLWTKLFVRDFRRLALEANELLKEKFSSKQISDDDLYRIPSQFYRSRVILPLSHHTTLQGHIEPGIFVVLPNMQLACSYEYGPISLWTKYTMNPLELVGHRDRVTCLLALSNNRLASASKDSTIRLWSTEDGSCLKILRGHKAKITCLIELSDGRLASGSKDRTIRLWNRLWNANGEVATVRVFSGHEAEITALTELPDGQLASASNDLTIRIWDKDGKCVRILSEDTRFVRQLIVLPDKRLVSNANDLRLWNLQDEARSRVLCPHEAKHVTLLPDGRLVWIPKDSNDIHMLSQADELIVLKGHTFPVKCFEMFPNGQLVSTSDDCTIRLWPKEGGQGRIIYSGNLGEAPRWLTILSDGRLVSRGANYVYLWTSDGRKIGELPRAMTQLVGFIATLPDGRLITKQVDPSTVVWDVAPTELVNEAIKRANSMVSGKRGYRQSCVIS